MAQFVSFDDMEIPRPVSTELRLSVFFGNIYFSFGSVFLLGGVFALIIFGKDTDFSSRFIFGQNDPTCTGVITNVFTTSNGDDAGDIVKYAVSYSVNGARYSSSSYSSSIKLKETDTTTVQYIAKNPAIAVIPGMSRAPFGLDLGFVIILLFPVTGLFLLIPGARRALRNLRLLQYGIRTTGRITNKLDGFMSFNENPVYIYVFTFQTKDGKTLESRIKSIRDLREDVLQYILYDPQDIRKATLVEALSGTAQKFIGRPKKK
ncbi:MAG: hypothetical protein K0S33_2020 [Bacteroidetes bacterium]|jgi:hypothetical protein|nr:hypothetical protein [Bacteroidota bacterium]